MVVSEISAPKISNMISVEKISIKKGKTQIVHNASFQIRPEKITVLIGKNGAGKSTLFEALTGNNPLSRGKISWDGILLKHLNKQELAYRRAVVSQSVKLGFPIKVKEVIEMGTYASEEYLPKEKIDHLIQHALSKVDMLDFENRMFPSLSGGEQKRVLLAKCIVQLNCTHWADRNKYLFLDEPTASLDLQQQFKLIETIRYLVRRRRIGVFMILHDVNLAAQIADEILFIKDGRLSAKGTPSQVITKDHLKDNLDINAIIQNHPVFNCPHIISLPERHTLVAS
jgi:iron complex transport system ATP-binding protein